LEFYISCYYNLELTSEEQCSLANQSEDFVIDPSLLQ
jgi:hypothetical protein